MKRLFDMVCAALGLVVLAPVLAWVAWRVGRNLGSPVLFRQVRPGLQGRPFAMIKFRTMRDAVAPDGTPLPDVERLTAFGRWLRATSLDELPDLHNNLMYGSACTVGKGAAVIVFAGDVRTLVGVPALTLRRSPSC